MPFLEGCEPAVAPRERNWGWRIPGVASILLFVFFFFLQFSSIGGE